MIVFRIVHITSAILWLGGAVFYSAFVESPLRAAGPDAAKLFSHLVLERKAVVFFVTVATSTVVAGAFLYWRDSSGLDTTWMQTGFGTGLTVGAVAGLVSWLIVVLVLAPTSYRLLALGDRIASGNGPPSAEQMAFVDALQSRLNTFAVVTVATLTIAAVAMASARYLPS